MKLAQTLPRPCSVETKSLAEINYYRGENRRNYNLIRENIGDSKLTTLINQMSPNAEFTCKNGERPDNMVTYTQSTQTISVQTNEETNTCEHAVIRDCNIDNGLLELHFNINVLPNTPPIFLDELETSFEIVMKKLKPAKVSLPTVVDKERNAKVDTILDATDGREASYPAFVRLEDVITRGSITGTNLVFEPLAWNRGQKYYFSIILQEQNSVYIYNEYFCDVTVSNGIAERDPGLAYTDIEFTIEDLA